MTDSVPAHVATPYGFWADAQGTPGARATIGASHSYVHFGPDGYVDMILVQPGSSSGSTETQYNIPFNPWAYGSAQPPTQPPDSGGEEPPTDGGSEFPTCPDGFYFNVWTGRCEPNVGEGDPLPPPPVPEPTDKIVRTIDLLEAALRILKS